MNAIVATDLSKFFKFSKQGKKDKKNKYSINENNLILAVDKISFEVKNGEIFGFLGPNGAGKTTTIRMMTGVLKPTEGTIQIFGENIWKHPNRVKQIIGNVPEMANVYFDLTGLQNLTFIGEIYGIPKKERITRAENLLKKFELFERRHSKAKKYSKGMKQRLLLCMALMSDPKILVLDEPTSGLDVQSARIIKQLIKEYNKMGMTIFMTTHDMDVANELCDRIAIINKGKIIGLDSPENLRNLKQEYQAIDLYLYSDLNQKEIENLNSIKEVIKRNDHYHIIVHNLNESIFQIIDFLRSNNLKVKKINTYEPHLEDVFVKMVDGGGHN